MKFSIDIECTAEEARTVLGLPDLSTVHEAYAAQLKKLVEEGLQAGLAENIIRSWSPLGEPGIDAWKRVMDNLGGMARK